MSVRPWALIAVSVLLASAGVAPVRTQPADNDGVVAFLRNFEKIVQAGDTPGFLALTDGVGDRKRAREFAAFQLLPGATRTVVQERDRAGLQGTLPGMGHRLLVDVFIEYGDRARAATWRLDVRRIGNEWRLADEEQLTSTENLYRLSLNTTKEYDARDLVIEAEDFSVHLVSGSVFLSDIDQGVTGLVLLGNGRMQFRPRPDTEKGQVRIFCGSETLDAPFEAAFVRINPAEFDSRVDARRLTARPVSERDLHRADEVFREEMPNSFNLDLGDLSHESWSLLPPYGDVLAEVRTRKFGTLTYARSSAEPEDITLFDRTHRHNIALYASEEKLARRGRFYNEDDLADYDVNDYDIDLTVSPDRLFIQGRATLRLKVRAAMLNALTFKLADPLAVQSIVATRFGRLFPIRVRNQNAVVVNLPSQLPHGTEILVTIVYAGRLEPQRPDQESLQAGRPPSRFGEDVPEIEPEPSFLYSNRSYWYPQGSVTDYATARIRLTVPAMYDCVASGDLANGYPTSVDPATDPSRARKVYLFRAVQPVRYLAFVVSRFTRTEPMTVALPQPAQPPLDGDQWLLGVSYDSLSLAMAANPRQVQRGRQLLNRTAEIAKYYTSLVGDCPYPSFTIALVEKNLPGGHSPGYFTALNQPLPTTPFVWRNDPASFENYPDFFIAHELAHQWWGQAVGWRNYHEQWISEGFAQYFAALYAEHQRGGEVFSELMRHLRRWALQENDQGPIYLGYRLGHIKNDGKVFRALVYDKGAAVLHMLRRLVGDEAFFRGLQRFYRTSRFRKVGTEDFRAAMEHESGESLERFFELWVYGSKIPRLKFAYREETSSAGRELVLRVEQVGDVFDVPVPVQLEYADRKQVDVIIRVMDRSAEMRIPLTGQLRDVEVRDDDGMLARMVR